MTHYQFFGFRLRSEVQSKSFSLRAFEAAPRRPYCGALASRLNLKQSGANGIKHPRRFLLVKLLRGSDLWGRQLSVTLTDENSAAVRRGGPKRRHFSVLCCLLYGSRIRLVVNCLRIFRHCAGQESCIHLPWIRCPFELDH